MASTWCFFKRTSSLERWKAVGLRRVVIAGVAAATMWGGIGVTPASAAETYGAPLPNYDPGVHGTIRYDLANCGIVMYEHVNYQGKKLCGPAVGDAFQTTLFSLDSTEAASLGADMDWRRIVSSIQVRPGFVLELVDLSTGLVSRSYLVDTPDLGDFNDRTTAVRVRAYNWGEGNNNAANGQPVTTNAASCTGDQGPEKAVDNSVASIYVNKWCGATYSLLGQASPTPPTLQVDLGADRLIRGVVIHHAGDGPLASLLGLAKFQRELDLYNTKAYNIKVSSSPTGPWTLAGSFGNTWSADVSNHWLMSADNRLYRARYVQLEVTVPNSLDWVARIQEFEVLTLNR